MAVYDTARVTDGARTLAEAVGWLYVLSLPALTAAFALGLISQRLFFADALKRLTVSLSSHPDAAELRAAMAEALQDRSLRVAFRTGGERGGWVDEHGASVEPPSPGNGLETAMTEAGANGHRVAVIAEDVGLSHDPAFLRAATAYTLDDDRERPARRPPARLRARARPVADADRHRGGARAPEDRARSSRRRPAAPRRAADQARAGRRQARGRGRRRPRRPCARSRSTSTPRWRRSAPSPAACTRPCWPSAGSARRCAPPTRTAPLPAGVTLDTPRPLPARGRGDGLLRLHRGAAERGQARTRKQRDDRRSPTTTAHCASRSPTTGPASTRPMPRRAPAWST